MAAISSKGRSRIGLHNIADKLYQRLCSLRETTTIENSKREQTGLFTDVFINIPSLIHVSTLCWQASGQTIAIFRRGVCIPDAMRVFGSTSSMQSPITNQTRDEGDDNCPQIIARPGDGDLAS